jgi:hypothetical protein
MTGLKLYGMRASFDEIAGKGLARRDELYPFLGSLIRAELAHRQSSHQRREIPSAEGPRGFHLRGLAGRRRADSRTRRRRLIDAKRNLILIGGTESAS